MKTQLIDTNAKMVICYEKSRNIVYEALKDLGLLGKVTVIVLELACPKQGQDRPITEPGFQFFKDIINGKFENPPKLQNGKLDDNETFVIFWSSGTTGIPKGIQHCVRYFRKLVNDYIERGSQRQADCLGTVHYQFGATRFKCWHTLKKALK